MDYQVIDPAKDDICRFCDDYQRLVLAVGWLARERAAFIEAMKRSYRLLFAVDENNEVAGAARLVGDGVYNLIMYDLVVHPRYQGRGIAKQIIEQALHVAGTSSVARLECFAAEESEEYYASTGWQRIDGFYRRVEK